MQLGDEPLIPDIAIASEHLDFYFETCVITYRCLHRGYVTQWVQKVVSNQAAGLPLYYGIGHAKASIVFTILAIVSLRKSKIGNSAIAFQRGDTPTDQSLRHSDPFFCASTRLTDVEVGLPTLESAQARILQVLYLLQSARMNQAWYVFGSTLPIVSALGLHRKSGRNRAMGNKGQHYDYISSQCRKRTFWVAYTIDKYLAAVFGRPRLYHDDDIDQDFPDCVNDEDMTPQGKADHEPQSDCHIDSLVNHAKIAQLIDRISRDVYSIKKVSKRQRLASAHKFVRAIHEWRESLPHHLGTVRPSSLVPAFRRQATAMKLAYCHAIMHATRPFLLGFTGAGGNSALEDSVGECISAAKTALETVDSMSKEGTLFHAYWWTPYVTFCALAVVYVWEIQQIRGRHYESHGLHDLLNLADKCQKHLARATEPDSPSHRYSVILEELRQEAKSQAGRAPWRGQSLAEQDNTPTGQDAMMVDPDIDHSHLVPEDFADAHSDLNMEQQAFDSGPGFFGTGLLESWETTDWLDLDSSVSNLLQ